jgi:CheY-like chemotaxis protein
MKILIVDDSTIQRMILRRILTRLGYFVVEAANGLVAAEKLAQNPDVIVCDLLMPRVDGYELLAHMKERGHTIPVVVASADFHPTVRDTCRGLGAVGFIDKPYEADQIRSVLAEVVASVGKPAPTKSLFS